MKRIALALLLAGVALPAFAVDNTVIVTPGSGVTMRSRDVGAGVESMITILGDTGGNPSGTFANYGTSPGAVLVPGMNAFVTNSPAVTQSGTWTVQPGNTANTTPWLFQGNISNASDAIATGSISAPAIAYNYIFNGTTWDRVRGASGAPNIGVPDGNDVTQGAKADAVCASATANACSEIAMLKFIANGVIGPVATQANTVSIGAVGLSAPTTGGCTGQVILTAATNNATQIKASAGTLCSLRWENTTTSVFSIRFYDTATAPSGGAPCNSASNVVSNDVAQSNATSPGGIANLGPYGQSFGSGIVVCITGANTNSDNTNAALGLNLNLSFK